MLTRFRLKRWSRLFPRSLCWVLALGSCCSPKLVRTGIGAGEVACPTWSKQRYRRFGFVSAGVSAGRKLRDIRDNAARIALFSSADPDLSISAACVLALDTGIAVVVVGVIAFLGPEVLNLSVSAKSTGRRVDASTAVCTFGEVGVGIVESVIDSSVVTAYRSVTDLSMLALKDVVPTIGAGARIVGALRAAG